ncbi:MAG: bacillithiol biosynthesis cysteine-adding enzyme BshC [Candidatus Sumerlaeia bacterium]
MTLPEITAHYLQLQTSATSFFAGPPVADWDRWIEARRRRPGLLADHPAALEEIAAFNHAMGNDSVAVRRNLERLADPAALAVLTGQQAGLLLSPLFIVYKAAGTLLLASQIESRTGEPAVPIFWIASDDHDLAEVSVVRWIAKDGALAEFTLDTNAPAPGTPVYRFHLRRDEGRALLDRLRTTTLDTEFKSQWLDRLESLFESEPTLEEVFARLLARLFGERGLVLVTPRLPALRRLGACVLRGEIERPGELTRAVLENAGRLKTAGYEAPLHRREGDCNFFLERQGRRHKVRYSGGRFHVIAPDTSSTAETLEAAELTAMLEREPEHFSPNVVTRPLIQDAVFPTIAYVGGPGEIAYHAQLDDAYHKTGVFRPIIWPRPRVTLIEPRVRRALEKLGTTPEQYMTRTLDEWRDDLWARSPRSTAQARFDALRSRMEQTLDQLDADLSALGPPLKTATRKTAETIRFALDKLRERLDKHLMLGDEHLHRLEKIELALRPLRLPQERVFNPVCPFLFNYGEGLIESIMNAVDIEQFDGQFVHL